MDGLELPWTRTTFLRDLSQPHILLSGLHGNPPNMFFHVSFLNSYHLYFSRMIGHAAVPNLVLEKVGDRAFQKIYNKPLGPL